MGMGMGPRGLDALSSLSSQFRGSNDGVRSISSADYNQQHNSSEGDVRIDRHDNVGKFGGRNSDSDDDRSKSKKKKQKKRAGMGMTLGRKKQDKLFKEAA